MAEAKVINHLCTYFWGISLTYFSNQVFWSMLPVPDFSVLYVRFWMSPALIHRVLPLARIISLAWIFSMTNPLPNSFHQQHLSALKHQVTTMAFGKPLSFALALQVGLARFHQGPFLPSGCSSTISVSLATVSKFWVSINNSNWSYKRIRSHILSFSLAYTSGSVWRVIASCKQLHAIPQIQLICSSQSLFALAYEHRIPLSLVGNWAAVLGGRGGEVAFLGFYFVPACWKWAEVCPQSQVVLLGREGLHPLLLSKLGATSVWLKAPSSRR